MQDVPASLPSEEEDSYSSMECGRCWGAELDQRNPEEIVQEMQDRTLELDCEQCSIARKMDRISQYQLVD